MREKLGYYDMPSSYLEFLIESITGLNVSSKLVDIFAVIFLLFAICISTYVNFRDFKRRK
ncbi:hypothetical protein NLC36_02630 [Candidatus Aminicenantes bacterium AC-335-L06]|nr:hypothetical protein [Candidatus Aminicenantes bacterium AC-335-L06]